MKNSSPADTRPDHEVAAAELAALFSTLGLTVEISGLHAAIDNEGDRKWAHVGATVTYTRAAKGNTPAASASFEWKMGTGLIDWRAVLKCTNVSRDDYPVIKAMAGQGSLSPAGQTAICAKHLPAFRAAVNPAEVLARSCEDGRSAETTFADWAANYGYDTDSRKAEAIYFACQENGTKARRLVGAAIAEQMAELVCRL